MDNLKTGFASLSMPVVKFGLKTVPGLLSNSLKTANSATSKIINGNKVGFRKVVIGSGNAIGGGTVLASSIIGGKMQVIGSGLSVLGTLIDVAAKLSLNVTSQVGDVAVVGNTVVADMSSGALEGLGNGMKDVSHGVNGITRSTSNLINAISNSIQQNILDAQATFSNMIKSGLIKFQDKSIYVSSEAEETYYNALNGYLKTLLGMEAIINKLNESVKSKGSLNHNDAIAAAADVTAELAAADPVAADNPALAVSADLTAALAATNTEDSSNPALSAAANITAALAALTQNPLESINPALAAAAKLTASLAATDPDESDDAELSVAEDITAALAATNTEEAKEDALVTTAGAAAELATTKPEGSVNPALLAAASITSALAALDPGYSSSNTETTDSG